MTLPHITVLHCTLHYEPATGFLFWKRRARAFFPSDRAWRTWNARYAGRRAFAHIDHQGYARGSLDSVPHGAHRIIWKMVTCQEPDQIDHIDGNRSNNRIDNLRSVSNAENCRNRRRRSDNTSGVVGVRFNRGRWQARIFTNGKDVSLGYFADFEAAVAARKAAEREHGFHPNHGRAA